MWSLTFKINIHVIYKMDYNMINRTSEGLPFKTKYNNFQLNYWRHQQTHTNIPYKFNVNQIWISSTKEDIYAVQYY